MGSVFLLFFFLNGNDEDSAMYSSEIRSFTINCPLACQFPLDGKEFGMYWSEIHSLTTNCPLACPFPLLVACCDFVGNSTGFDAVFL